MALDYLYDPACDIITIEGIHYSGDLFRSMRVAPVGTWLRITERRDGVVKFVQATPINARSFDAIAGVPLQQVPDRK
jgi:hypothetical protein